MATELSRSDRSARLGPRGWVVLVTLCGATFMTGLDFSVITVALPEIGRDLGFTSVGQLQWVSTACVLPTAALLPLCGRLSDRIGRRRLFIAGVLAFGVCSLAAGLATAPGPLIAARAGQGVAAAAIGATAIALLTTVFAEGRQRTRALAVNGVLLSLGFVVGTMGGGVITSGLSWRWTMLVLVLIGAIVLVGAASIPGGADQPVAARLDVPGAVLAGGGLFTLVYAVSAGPAAGWASPSIWGSLVAAVVLFAGFFAVEARHPAPLVPPGVLRRRTVKYSFLVGLITFGMCGGATVLLSLYMQNVLGYSPLAAGFGFLAEGGAAIAAGALASRLIAAHGTRTAMVAGLLVQAAGTGAMAWLAVDGPLTLLLATSAVMGFGHVLAVVSFVNTLTSGLPTRELGVAGGLAQLPQFVGSVGVAGLAAIAAARAGGLTGTATPAATLAGIQAAVLTAAVILLAGALVAARCLPGRSPDRPRHHLR
jgi:EmrB/QacA subfamily drug resistance transporter